MSGESALDEPVERLTAEQSARWGVLLKKRAALRFYWSAVRSVLWHTRYLIFPLDYPDYPFGRTLFLAIGICFSISAIRRYIEMRDCGSTVLNPW